MGGPSQSQRPSAQHIWAFPSPQVMVTFPTLLFPLHGEARQWVGWEDGSGLGATYLGLLLRMDPQLHGFEEVAGNKPLLQRR